MMPRQGQSVESCVLVDWLVSRGDEVKEGQVLANIETDKAVFELESPAAGTIVDLFFEEGDDIPVLINIGAIGSQGEDVDDLRPDPTTLAAAQTETQTTEAPSSSALPAPSSGATAPPAAGGGGGISPRARNAAARGGVNVNTLAGTGPGGRIIERDVLNAAANMPHMNRAAAEAASQGMTAPAQGSGPGGMVLARDLKAPAEGAVGKPLSGIRKLIAGRMHQSLATTAQLTLHMSFNATAIMTCRAHVKEKGKSLGLPNITINDILAYNTVKTLVEFPEMNAHFLGNRIAQYPDVNMGIATDTERGLMVPVVHGANNLSLAEFSVKAKQILKDAQAASINPDLLSGGTFTITNMGMLGIEKFTPILNAPEVGILGVGCPHLQPVMRDGEVTHIQAITLSLTIDHQAVDGAPGARFLKELCMALETFELTTGG